MIQYRETPSAAGGRERMDAGMDCLFVIDYQKDFVDGALGFPGAEKLDAAIAARVREYGPGRVWFTQDTHTPDYLSTREGALLPVIHCVRGTPGWENYGQTAAALAEVGAVGIEKPSFGMDTGGRMMGGMPAIRPEVGRYIFYMPYPDRGAAHWFGELDKQYYTDTWEQALELMRQRHGLPGGAQIAAGV